MASALTKFPDWSLVLAKRIVRYLLGTSTQGLRYPLGGSEQDLVAWSDAGYAGASTRSQSGSVLAWGGATVQWRSAKQHSSALSTCEAEVAAAASAWQVAEGLLCLLQEWDSAVVAPLLLIDNKAAPCGLRTRRFLAYEVLRRESSTDRRRSRANNAAASATAAPTRCWQMA